MEVKFADSFAKSLEKLISDNRWYNRAWRWIRYDMPNFLKNIWRFRKALWNHHWWDHHSSLDLLKIALTDIANGLETRGLEVNESRLKKVAAIRRAVELIDNYNNDKYIELAEAELGEIISRGPLEFKECEDQKGYFELIDNLSPADNRHNRKVYRRADAIAQAQWKELWRILQGQNYKEYSRKVAKLSKSQRLADRDIWTEWFDGSGMRGWWD